MSAGTAIASARGEFVVGVVIIVVGQTDLLEVVGAAHAVGGFAHFLHGGNQQADKHGDDGYNYQQFDESEALAFPGTSHWKTSLGEE